MQVEMTRVQPEGGVFGQRLRELRQKRGVTQEQLSIATGMTEGYISNMERGLKVPSLTTILRIAVALKCKPSALVSVFDNADIESLLPM